MQPLDLKSRPILPEYQSNQDSTPPRIEIDAFWFRAGESASNCEGSSCTPSNCPMFTPNLGNRPSLDVQSSSSSVAEI